MDTTNQRLAAAKLARELNAPKTLEIINDDEKNSPIDAILQEAVTEVGLDKLVDVILKSDYPYWAIGALRYLPNLGDHAAALKKKAGVVSLSRGNAMENHSVALAQGGIPTIRDFKMYVACGAGYVSSFTIWYFTPPFNNTWVKSVKQSGSKKPVCQSETKDCSFFSVPNNPLKTGDTVMMVLSIAGNIQWVPTGFWFRYDPASSYTAEIDCRGTTLNPYFSHSVIQN